MKFVHYDETGLPTAFYDQSIHGDTVPPTAVEITDDQHRECINHPGARRIVVAAGGAVMVEPYTPPPTPVSDRRHAALTRIDTAAGKARLRYVSAGHLIEEEYRQAKFAAQAWRAAGSPADDVPPEIQSGAEYSDITNEAAAVEIEQTAARWEGVLSAIRDLRLGGKAAVKAAADDAIESTAQGYIVQLEAMEPVET